jgi:hypothetical protein
MQQRPLKASEDIKTFSCRKKSQMDAKKAHNSHYCIRACHAPCKDTAWIASASFPFAYFVLFRGKNAL